MLIYIGCGCQLNEQNLTDCYEVNCIPNKIHIFEVLISNMVVFGDGTIGKNWV